MANEMLTSEQHGHSGLQRVRLLSVRQRAKERLLVVRIGRMSGTLRTRQSWVGTCLV
jgi:hypothetical protein